jgi:hypothetical protein
MRKYAALWNQLKTDRIVSYTVTKAGHRRIWNGIKLEKTLENTARKAVGLSGWSKLVIHTEELNATHVKVTLTFYDLMCPSDVSKL